MVKKKIQTTLSPKPKGQGLKKFMGIIAFGLFLPLATVLIIATVLKQNDAAAQGLGSENENAVVGSFTFEQQADENVTPNSDTALSNEPTAVAYQIPAIPESYCVPADSAFDVGIVSSVQDAETLLVRLLSEEEVLVRYLGLSVEDVDQNTLDALNDANQDLVGQLVILVADSHSDSEGEPLYRYVFAGDYFINYHLLAWGLASVDKLSVNLNCHGFLLAAQDEAIDQHLGIWEYPDRRMEPEEWRNWPVVPTFSEYALNLYLDGIAAGNDPTHFSIMGDCQSPEWRLFGHFEYQAFVMPDQYAYMQPTLDNYAGQWLRDSTTVHSGNTVASMFSVFSTDLTRCEATETPIECELRINNPSVAIIMLGTNWGSGRYDEWEARYRDVLNYLIDHKVMPILVTKADATEPDYPLNQIVTRLAYEYDLPMWNFWSSIQELENHGLDPEDERQMHLSLYGLEMKRWTGLQALHALRVAAEEYQTIYR